MPLWIKSKAKLLLEGKVSIDGEIIFEKSLMYFKIDSSYLKGRERVQTEMKHLIRYGMYLNGVSFKEISKITKCDRTTIFYAIETIKNISSVDKDFDKKVKDYLKYIS